LVFAGLGLGKNLNADPDTAPDPDHKKILRIFQKYR
jgi:hypothetical protein